MRTQVRTIALITATVAVVSALLVLFIRVRSAQEIVVPEEALSEARARFERGQTRTGGRVPEASASVQADRSAAATRRSPRPSMAEPPAQRPRPGAAEVPQASDRPASALTSETQAEHDAVRAAYDRGDFEQALDLAEKFLSRHGRDEYVKRVAVVSACALGEEAVAMKHYQEALPRDQPIVAKRCRRYGVQF